MKNFNFLLCIAVAVSALSACNSDEVEHGTEATVSESSVDVQNVKTLKEGFTSLNESSKILESTGYNDIMGTYVEQYSNYSFDSAHLTYNIINTLMNDNVLSGYKTYALALLMKGSFTADTITKKWVYSSSTGLKFVYPDKSGNKCSIQLSLIRDSSIFYNALSVQMERNDSVKATVRIKHLLTTVTMGDDVITITRNKYSSKPATMKVQLDTKSFKNALLMTYTADSTNIFGGRFLLSKRGNFDIQATSLVHVAGNCSDMIKFASCLAIAEKNRNNESIFKKYLAMADTLVSADSYFGTVSSNNRVGAIKLRPYQRKVNDAMEWYAALCIVTDSGDEFSLFSDVDITEMPMYMYNLIK